MIYCDDDTDDSNDDFFFYFFWRWRLFVSTLSLSCLSLAVVRVGREALLLHLFTFLSS